MQKKCRVGVSGRARAMLGFEERAKWPCRVVTAFCALPCPAVLGFDRTKKLRCRAVPVRRAVPCL
eukprot:5589063-Pyramimonas_sp.AAC.1